VRLTPELGRSSNVAIVSTVGGELCGNSRARPIGGIGGIGSLPALSAAVCPL
jgi:hypothetical protein